MSVYYSLYSSYAYVASTLHKCIFVFQYLNKAKLAQNFRVKKVLSSESISVVIDKPRDLVCFETQKVSA